MAWYTKPMIRLTTALGLVAGMAVMSAPSSAQDPAAATKSPDDIAKELAKETKKVTDLFAKKTTGSDGKVYNLVPPTITKVFNEALAAAGDDAKKLDLINKHLAGLTTTAENIEYLAKNRPGAAALTEGHLNNIYTRDILKKGPAGTLEDAAGFGQGFSGEAKKLDLKGKEVADLFGQKINLQGQDVTIIPNNIKIAFDKHFPAAFKGNNAAELAYLTELAKKISPIVETVKTMPDTVIGLKNLNIAIAHGNNREEQLTSSGNVPLGECIDGGLDFFGRVSKQGVDHAKKTAAALRDNPNAPIPFDDAFNPDIKGRQAAAEAKAAQAQAEQTAKAAQDALAKEKAGVQKDIADFFKNTPGRTLISFNPDDKTVTFKEAYPGKISIKRARDKIDSLNIPQGEDAIFDLDFHSETFLVNGKGTITISSNAKNLTVDAKNFDGTAISIFGGATPAAELRKDGGKSWLSTNYPLTVDKGNKTASISINSTNVTIHSTPTHRFLVNGRGTTLETMQQQRDGLAAPKGR